MTRKQKKISLQPPGKGKKIPVNDLLADASVYTLRKFLRNEIKRNKQLNIRLKTELISDYTPGDSDNKYHLLLSELIREDKYGIIKLSKRETRFLIEICTDLLRSAEEMIAERFFIESWDLLHAVLTNLHRYYGKTTLPDNYELLDSILHRANNTLTALLQCELAPELKDHIYESITALIDRSYHRLGDNHQNNLIAVLASAKWDEAALQRLCDIVADKLDNAREILIWTYWYAVLSLETERVIDPERIHDLLSNREVFRIAEWLRSAGLSDVFGHWIRAFSPDLELPSLQRRRWREWHFKIQIEDDRKDQILEYGLNMMRDTGDISYYDAMVERIDPSAIVKILEKTHEYGLLAHIASHTQDWSALQYAVVSSKDLELLSKYATHLESNLEGFHAVAGQMVIEFLRHHAGHACSDEINLLLDGLSELDLGTLVDSIHEDIEEAFPGRFVFDVEGLNISS